MNNGTTLCCLHFCHQVASAKILRHIMARGKSITLERRLNITAPMSSGPVAWSSRKVASKRRAVRGRIANSEGIWRGWAKKRLFKDFFWKLIFIRPACSEEIRLLTWCFLPDSLSIFHGRKERWDALSIKQLLIQSPPSL